MRKLTKLFIIVETMDDGTKRDLDYTTSKKIADELLIEAIEDRMYDTSTFSIKTNVLIEG